VANDLLGDYSERDPPVPIPNTEVKPLSPDCTARASVWESRKLPGLNTKASEKSEAFLLVRQHVRQLGVLHPAGGSNQTAVSPQRSGLDTSHIFANAPTRSSGALPAGRRSAASSGSDSLWPTTSPSLQPTGRSTDLPCQRLAESKVSNPRISKKQFLSKSSEFAGHLRDHRGDGLRVSGDVIEDKLPVCRARTRSLP
jgi:hypothetical protein